MGTSGGSEETTGAMRERIPGGRPVVWMLVRGNRVVVTTALLAAGYVILLVLSRIAPGSASKIFAAEPVFALFTPVVIGIIMGVSLVLTFNQLVLAQELGPAGDQRERMRDALDFRRDVEDVVDSGASPPEPSMFLRGLIETTDNRAAELLDLLGDASDEASEAAREYAENIREDAGAVADELEGTQFGQFEVVQSALEYNYSWKIYAGRRVRERHADDLSDEAETALDELLEALEFFGPAREHFKTLYFRWEIINVSRALVYLAVPALAVTAYMILVFEPDGIAGSTLGFGNALLFTGLGLAVGASPFALFLSYILRIVTIAKWTLAIGPFVLRETKREDDDIDWE